MSPENVKCSKCGYVTIVCEPEKNIPFICFECWAQENEKEEEE